MDLNESKKLIKEVVDSTFAIRGDENSNSSDKEFIIIDVPKKDRLKKFIETHNMTDKYSVKELSRWHMLLTQSCTQGRKKFAEQHNLDIEHDYLTVPEFLRLVEGYHGAEIMNRLKYKIKKGK